MLNPVRLAAVALGGATGAVARYGLSGWMAMATKGSPFPYGTLSVNVLGAALLGFVMGTVTSGRWIISPAARDFLTIGLLGAFTTFSTFSYETVQATRLGYDRIAVANVAVSLLLGLAACWIGLTLGRSL
ncbi:MAG: fluoride efflux transporter CrcB [Acidobacteria bacterium]|nr:fluoride efflux transporter CrcB [Acidobacteriota bacterium]